MLNWLMRYQPVVRLLDELPDGTVVDVGSGWHGLSSYRQGLVVQTDLAFVGHASGPRPGTVSFIAASAETLPFGDDSFDYALSLDMFEHLPQHLRQGSVRELCRVARSGVLVGFPVGRPAKVVDETVYRLLRLGRRPVPDWLIEHRAQERYPDGAMLVAALPAGWVVTRAYKSGNVASQTGLVMAEHLPGGRKVTDRLEQRWIQRGVPRVLDRGWSYRTIYLVEPERVVSRQA